MRIDVKLCSRNIYLIRENMKTPSNRIYLIRRTYLPRQQSSYFDAYLYTLDNLGEIHTAY